MGVRETLNRLFHTQLSGEVAHKSDGTHVLTRPDGEVDDVARCCEGCSLPREIAGCRRAYELPYAPITFGADDPTKPTYVLPFLMDGELPGGVAVEPVLETCHIFREPGILGGKQVIAPKAADKLMDLSLITDPQAVTGPCRVISGQLV